MRVDFGWVNATGGSVCESVCARQLSVTKPKPRRFKVAVYITPMLPDWLVNAQNSTLGSPLSLQVAGARIEKLFETTPYIDTPRRLRAWRGNPIESS